MARSGALIALLGLLAGAASAPGVARAEEPALAEGMITRVVVRGTRFIEDAAVLANIQMRSGEALTPEKVRRDLRSVYRTGFFEDVRVLSVPDGDGVKVIFEVVEKPRVMDVRIEGNKKIDEEDLRELIDARAFGVLNDVEVQKVVDLMRDKYVEKGFYLAEVKPVITPVGEHRVDVVFKITENRKVIVQKIAFTGNDHVTDRQLKKYMETKEGGFAPWLTSSGSFDRDKLNMDHQRLQLPLWEEGYVEAKVDPPKVYLSPDKRYIFVSFHVTEGEKYNFGKIEAQGDFVEEEGLTEEAVGELIDGRALIDLQDAQWRAATGRRPPLNPKARRGNKLEEGETYTYSGPSEMASTISRLYQDQGYAYVNVVPSPRPNPATKTVDLTFHIDKGEKVRIGRISISGNDPTFDKVVRREIVVNEGDIYRGSLLDASKFRISRLGHFEDVQITTPPTDTPGVVDVNVKVTEQPTGSFSLGLGYSNLEKLAVNGSIQRSNFLGLGFTINASINWSRLRRQANLSFFDPYFLDSRWTFGIDGYWIERKFQLDEYERGASIRIGRWIDRRDDIQIRADYTIEDVGITSLDAYRQRMLGGALYRNGLTSQIGLSILIDKRNNRIFPTQGIFATAQVNFAGGFRAGEDKVVSLLGGDFNFVEINANLRFYQPLIPKSDMLVFRLNSSFGSIWSTDGQVIPFIHRYRAGGINSVRGFQWFSLGPQLRVAESDDPGAGDSSTIIGGTQTWVNNFEIESPIIKAAGISAVVFFDAGNTFGDPYGRGGVNPFELRTAAGFGIRWRSPIGPLRFELGFPLAPREDERKSVFDFSIGSFF